MRLVTLITDFGNSDYSVAAVKGAIYSHCPEVLIVDISHTIAPFNILQAGYVLKNAYRHFPQGTIHVVGVDAERTPERNHQVMLLNGHFFVGTDNGIFNLLSENEKDIQVFEIQTDQPITIFPTLDFFPKIVKEIYLNTPLDEIGIRTSNYLKTRMLQPEVSKDEKFIYGSIIYVDHYGNAVSNIHRSLFERLNKGRKFQVISQSYIFDKLSYLYTDVVNFNYPKNKWLPDGDKLILFNSADYLQFSIYKSDLKNLGGASTLLGIDYMSPVTVQFL